MPSKSSDPLRHYFDWLKERFEDPGIPDEKTLSLTVDIPPLVNFEGVSTLLQSLGYDLETVQANFPLRYGTRKVFVDFLLGRQEPNTWVLELKSPEQECSNPNFVEQLQDEMFRCRTPIGVLFNGHSAAIYVNPYHDALKKLLADRAEELKKRPVAQRHEKDPGGLFPLFSSLRRKVAMPDTIRLARKFVKALLPEPQTDEIRIELMRLLREPTTEVASAVLNVSTKLMDLRATPEVLLRVWPYLPGPEKPNTRVKLLVAEVCERLGPDALAQARIKGLSIKIHGEAVHGYQPVPPGPGVPDGLTVGGRSALVAKRIIKDLERLLARSDG